MTTSSPTCSRKWPEWVGAWPRLKGRQSPEFESKHDGDESEGDRAARFGSRIGLRCMPWEWLTLRAWLSLQPPDEYGDRVWTHRDVCVECTRQQGKTLLIVLRSSSTCSCCGRSGSSTPRSGGRRLTTCSTGVGGDRPGAVAAETARREAVEGRQPRRDQARQRLLRPSLGRGRRTSGVVTPRSIC
jgi:hypothetical protein